RGGVDRVGVGGRIDGVVGLRLVHGSRVEAELLHDVHRLGVHRLGLGIRALARRLGVVGARLARAGPGAGACRGRAVVTARPGPPGAGRGLRARGTVPGDRVLHEADRAPHGACDQAYGATGDGRDHSQGVASGHFGSFSSTDTDRPGTPSAGEATLPVCRGAGAPQAVPSYAARSAGPLNGTRSVAIMTSQARLA